MKKTNLARNTVLLSISMLITKGINLLMIPLFSSWLSTQDYGAFDLFCTYVSLLIPFITISGSDAIFRFCVDEEDIDKKRKTITTGLSIGAINSIIICGLIAGIGFAKHWDMTLPFIVLLLTELLNNHLLGFVRAIRKLDLYSISGVVTNVGIAIFVSLFVRYFRMGLKGIVYGYAAGYFLGEIFLIAITRYWRYLDFRRVSINAAKAMIGYAYPLIPNYLSWWIISVSDRTLISLFLGTAMNGIYAIAYKVPNFCASIFNMFSISWQEAAVELLDSDDRNAYYNKVYNQTTVVMISLCGGLLALNYFLFRYVFDVKYYDARLYSPILITSVIFSSLAAFLGGIQISLKRTKENGLTTMLGAVVNIVVDVALIRFIGLYAAAISTILANMVICAVRHCRMKRTINFKLARETRIYIGVYGYLFFMAYWRGSNTIAVCNLLLACVMFCVINRGFIRGSLNKMIHR